MSNQVVNMVPENKRRILPSSVKNFLEKRNVEHSQVEYKYTYSKDFPYSEMFQDTKTGKHIVVVSPEAKCSPINGKPIVLDWNRLGDDFVSGNNLMSIKVSGTKINKESDSNEFSWNPQLFIGEEEVVPDYIIPTKNIFSEHGRDFNILEWKYGKYCLRRLFIFSGYIREIWFFVKDPENDVKIVHNQSKKDTLDLGYIADPLNTAVNKVLDNDIEYVSKESFINSEFPVAIGATFNESISAGQYYLLKGSMFGDNGTFADMVSNTNCNEIRNTSTYSWRIACTTSACSTDQYSHMERGVLKFNTSSIDSSATINDADLTFHCSGYTNDPGFSTNIVVVPYTGSWVPTTSNWSRSYWGSSVGSSSTWSSGSNTSIDISNSAITKAGDTKLGVMWGNDYSSSDPGWPGTTETFYIHFNQVDLVVQYTQALSTVVTYAATNVVYNAARLNGNVTDSGTSTVTERGFEWGKTIEGWVNSGSSGSGTGTFYLDIGSLVTGTAYRARAYSINSSGTSYGGAVYFTPSILAPTILTVAASSITDVSARINGNVTNTGGENPTRYFKYGKTTSYELGSVNKGISGTGTYFHDLTSLDVDTLYYYQAYATNSGGTGYGTQGTFTTTGVPVVTTDAATSINPFGATLNGNVTDQGASPVTARGFQYGLTTGYGDSVGVGSGSGSFNTALTGLKSGTLYHFRSYATNSYDTSYGIDRTFTCVESRMVLFNGQLKTRSSEGTIVRLVNGQLVTGTVGTSGEIVLYQGQIRTQPT